MMDMKSCASNRRRFARSPSILPPNIWKDIEAVPRVVALHCLKCPIAAYFRAHHTSELCVNTWCKLDYPLARQWGSELTRIGTIASGATVCDFRWKAVTDTAEPDDQSPQG